VRLFCSSPSLWSDRRPTFPFLGASQIAAQATLSLAVALAPSGIDRGSGVPCSLIFNLVVFKKKTLSAVHCGSTPAKACSLSADLIVKQIKNRKAWALRLRTPCSLNSNQIFSQAQLRQCWAPRQHSCKSPARLLKHYINLIHPRSQIFGRSPLWKHRLTPIPGCRSGSVASPSVSPSPSKCLPLPTAISPNALLPFHPGVLSPMYNSRHSPGGIHLLTFPIMPCHIHECRWADHFYHPISACFSMRRQRKEQGAGTRVCYEHTHNTSHRKSVASLPDCCGAGQLVFLCVLCSYTARTIASCEYNIHWD
jgi:hypothetical protein